MEIDPTIFRPATFIEMSIDNLTRAMILGSILVVLVLFAFLYEWRTALISVVAIPLSLMAAALVLYLTGATINTMILAGFVIALGEVVDDAIIDIENIVRRLRENRAAGSPRSTAAVILDASLEIRSAVVYATLIIVLAISPVFFMGGLSGAFFQPLAFAYVLALLASMVVALTVTPALSLILLVQGAARAARVAARPLAAARYDAAFSRCILRAAAHGLRRHRPSWCCSALAVAAPARAVAAAVLQGARLPDALADQARHLPPGDGPDHDRGQRGAAGHPRRAQLRRPRRPRRRSRTRSSASTSPRTGSASIPRSTTTRRWPPSRRWSTAIPGSTATCRPT